MTGVTDIWAIIINTMFRKFLVNISTGISIFIYDQTIQSLKDFVIA